MQLQCHHPEKQQPTDQLVKLLWFVHSNTSSDSRRASGRTRNRAFWRCFQVSKLFWWCGLADCHGFGTSHFPWPRGPFPGASFCHFCRIRYHRLLLKNRLFLRHGRTRNGLLKGKIRVVASSDVGDMGGWIAVTGICHLLCHCYVRIVGNHAESQLAPAVISEKVTVFDLSLSVEFLAELEGAGQKALSKK
jgi:hypothetical protein